MKRSGMIALLMLCLLGAVYPVRGQESGGHRVIYINDAGEVTVYDTGSGSSTVILSIDNQQSRTYTLSASPTGEYVAVYARFEGENRQPAGFRLYVLSLTDNTLRYEADLLPPGYVYPADETLGTPQFELTRALGQLVWSNDGRYLAFISAAQGTADAFIWEAATNTAFPVNSNPQTATGLNWSPDGTWLIFEEVVTFGTGGGAEWDAFYALNLTTRETLTFTPPEPIDATGLLITGWRDENTAYYSALNFISGANGLFTLSLPEGITTALIPFEFEFIPPVFDPASRASAFIVPDIGVTQALVPGAYVWLPDATQPTFIRSGVFYSVEVVREGVFQFRAPEGDSLFSIANPTLQPLPPGDFGVYVSPVTDTVVMYRADGVYVTTLDDVAGANAGLIFSGELLVPLWSPDGVFFYSYGFAAEGAGLLQIDTQNRTVRLLDSRMAIGTPIEVAPLP